MGRARTFNSVIPDDLQLFEQTDIIKMFEYMEKTFHLSNKWHPTFKESLKKVERDVSEQEHFFRYTREHLDPSLQIILRRNDSVIFALARYLIRDRVREKQKELTAQRNFYRNGDWKSPPH